MFVAGRHHASQEGYAMIGNNWKSVQDRYRHEDRNTIFRFYWGTIKDGPASVREGRDVEVPIELCDVIVPADRQSNLIGVRAHSQSFKIGEEVVTYAMRAEDQYRRFRAEEQQVQEGTPIASVSWLDGSHKATLKALNVLTVETLAGLSGQPLKNLGPGGMAWQQAAEKYLKASKDGAEVTNLVRENAALKEAMASLSASGGADPRVKYAEIDTQGLKDAIKEKTGEVPRGNPSRTTLIRMLVEADRGAIPVQGEAQAA
jgi:hypothetical protein